MNLNKRLVGIAAIAGIIVVGGLGATVLAAQDGDRDGGREASPDLDEAIQGLFGPESAQAVQITASATPSDEENEAGEGAEGSEAGEGIEVGEAGEGPENEAVVAITPEQAVQVALAANPGATVSSVELDNEDGTLLYEVRLSNGKEVYVDPNTGALVANPDND